MRKTKKTLAILAIVAMVFTMIPMQVFAADATTYARIGGTTQYDTAAAIAKAGWTTADTAVIAVGATGNSYDALAAGPLAAKKSAPILLTEGNQLTAVTKTTLQDLGVKNVIIVGGTGVIKQAVEDSIKALGISTSRLAGFDAAETSVKVAQSIGSFSALVLAGGRGEDALSVAAIAAAKGYPILYTDKKTNLPDSVANYVAGLSGVSTSYVIGGVGVIQEDEALQLPGTKVRYGGYDAYDTNLAVIQGFASSLSFDKVYVANGQTKVDALAGAALAAKSGSAIVLTDNSVIPAAGFVSGKLSATSTVTALGGTAAVSDSILKQIVYSGTVEADPKVTGVTSPDSKSLVVTFDKAIVTNTAQPATVVVKKGADTVETTFAFLADAKTLNITAKADLAANTAYTITVTPVNRNPITTTYTTPSWAPTVSVAKGTANTLVVTFDKAVDDTKAVFEVKKGDTVVAQTAKFDDAKKVATLTLASNISAGTYTVNVTGLTTTALSATYTEPTPTALTVDSVSAINAKQVQVVFNQELDSTTAGTSSNYVIGGITLASTSGAALQSDKKTVILNTAAGMTNFQEYSLTVSGVKNSAVTSTVATTTQKFTVSDNQLPVVSSVVAKGSRVVTVKFSEPVKNATQLNGTALQNFLLDGVNIDTASSAVVATLSADGTTLTLSFAAGLTIGDHKLKLVQNSSNGIVDYANYAVPAVETTFTVANDTTVPNVASVAVNSQTQVTVTFSKPMNISTSGDLSKFYWNVSGASGDTAYAATSITKVDDSNYKVKFTSGSNYMPAGTVYFFVTNVSDMSGNIISGNVAAGIYKSQLTVASNTQPTASSAVAKDDSNIYVYFSTDMESTTAAAASNYTIKDASGDTISFTASAYDSTNKRVTLNTASPMPGGVYTVTASGVKDIVGNTITNASFQVAVTDTTAPTVGPIQWSGNSIVVNYSEPMAVSGNNAVTSLTNYQYKGTDLPSGTAITAFNNNKSVRITFPTTVTVGDTILVGYYSGSTLNTVADATGNLYQVSSTAVTLGLAASAIDLSAVSSITSAKIVDTTTVKFVLDSNFPAISTAYAGDFQIWNGTSWITPTTVTLDSTDKTNHTLIFTVASADKFNAASGAGFKLQTILSSPSSTDVFGVKFVGPVASAAVTATNGIKANLISAAVKDSTTILVDFDGVINLSTVNASDFVITQGSTTWTGSNITIASAGSANSKYLVLTLIGNNLAVDQTVTVKTVGQDYIHTLGTNGAAIAANTTGVQANTLAAVAITAADVAGGANTLEATDTFNVVFNKAVDVTSIGNVDGSTSVAATVSATNGTLTIAGLGTISGLSITGSSNVTVTLTKVDNFTVKVEITSVGGNTITKAAGNEFTFTAASGVKSVSGEAANTTFKTVSTSNF